MKLRQFSMSMSTVSTVSIWGALSVFLALGAVTACSGAGSSSTTIDPTNPDAAAGEGGPTAESDQDDGSSDPADQPPHSLGRIVLGESHGSGGASPSSPIVAASFVPDARVGRSCAKKLEDGCEIQETPKCSKVPSSASGCNSSESCVYDTSSCKAVCRAAAICEERCDVDEVCRPSAGGSGYGTCEKTDAFDAGPLAFSGTTTPITLFPPYRFESTGQGAPFLGGSEMRVQASGATEAGFEKFDEKFVATTFIQTTPSLSKIAKSKVFGSGALPIAWVPANDTIVIQVTGSGGNAICKVKDALGKFDVPRSVLRAAQGNAAAGSTLAISVSRQKKTVKKDKKAKGTISLGSVQPVGWLELVTMSSESNSFQGCGGSQEVCNETCTDLNTDRNNCGGCGISCTSSQTCSSGRCTGTTSSCTVCRSNAILSGGSCSTYYSSCSSSVDCSQLEQCARGCTSATCLANCEAGGTPAGRSGYASLKSCLTSYCNSSCGF